MDVVCIHFSIIKNKVYLLILQFRSIYFVGKSTLVKNLSSRLQGVRMFTPGPKFVNERAFFDQQPNHLRRAYYSLCNYAAALEIRDILSEKPVILDRYVAIV